MARRKSTICILGPKGAGVSTTAGCLLYKLGAVDISIMEKLQKDGIGQYDQIPAYFEKHNIPKTFETPAMDLEFVEAHSNASPDLSILLVSNDTMSAVQNTIDSLSGLPPGCKRLLVLVNKLDAANWDQILFDDLTQRLKSQISAKPDIGREKLAFVPFCALTGENLLAISSHTPWYRSDRGVDATGVERGTVVEILGTL